MTVLTIPTSELRRLAGLDAADTSADAALAALAAAEQPALEWALDPATLADDATGVRLVLTLGVSELLAGSYVQQTARAPAPLGVLAIGALRVNTATSSDLRNVGLDLTKTGTERLAPYTRAGIIAAAHVAALAVHVAAYNAALLTMQQALAADAVAHDNAKLTILQATAANAAALDAAKLIVAQAAAAKVAPIDPATLSLLNTGLAGSLFGTLNPQALGTDDAEPPNEFSTGFAPLSDDNPDPFFETVEEGA